jgi:hypothetical protein
MTKTIVSSSSLADKPSPRRSDVAVSGVLIALTRFHSLPGQDSASSIMSRGTNYLALHLAVSRASINQASIKQAWVIQAWQAN